MKACVSKKFSILAIALSSVVSTAHAQAILLGDKAKFVEITTLPMSAASATESRANIVTITSHPVTGTVRATDGLLTLADSRGQIYTVNPSTGATTQVMNVKLDSPELHDSSPGAGNSELALRGFAYHPDFLVPGTEGYLKFYTMSCHKTTTRSRTDAAVLNHNIPLATAPIDAGRPRPFVPCDNVLAEWQMKAPLATDTSFVRDTAVARREVLRFPQMYANHGTDALVFDPLTKLLYVAAGDGGNQGDPLDVAENPAFLYGKILRINPLKPPADPTPAPSGMTKSNDRRWSYPMTNPGYGNSGRDAYYARGFRHPETMFIHDRDLIIADIGGALVEEINVLKLHQTGNIGVPAGDEGKSFGWDKAEGRNATFEGTSPVNGPTIPPVAQYTHSQHGSGPAAVIVGGVPDNTMGNVFNGQLILGDIISGKVYYGPIAAMKAARTWGTSMVALKQVDLHNNAGVRQSLMAACGNSAQTRVDLRLSEIRGTIYGTCKQSGKLFRLAPIL